MQKETEIMRVLGKNMAWLLKMREQTKDTLAAPETEPKYDKLYPVNVNTPISFAEKLYFIMKENKYDDEKFFHQYSQNVPFRRWPKRSRGMARITKKCSRTSKGNEYWI